MIPHIARIPHRHSGSGQHGERCDAFACSAGSSQRSSRNDTVTVTVTVVTVTGHVARPTGALPRRLRHAARTSHDLPARTHDLSRRSPPRAQPRSRTTHTNTQPPKQAHLLPAPHIQPRPAAVTQLDPCGGGPITYTNPHPDHNPRRNATPPAPHQQLPPRPLVDTTHSTRARQRAAPEVSVCRAEHAKQTRKHRCESSRNMTNAGFTKRTCPSPWRE
jgi:hypothetical protein